MGTDVRRSKRACLRPPLGSFLFLTSLHSTPASFAGAGCTVSPRDLARLRRRKTHPRQGQIRAGYCLWRDGEAVGGDA